MSALLNSLVERIGRDPFPEDANVTKLLAALQEMFGGDAG